MMAVVEKKVDKNMRVSYLFECPGCGCHHSFVTSSGEYPSPEWWYNESRNTPTFKPSLLVKFVDENGDQQCHSFVENGKIRFLNDCAHELAGKTVDMIEI